MKHIFALMAFLSFGGALALAETTTAQTYVYHGAILTDTGTVPLERSHDVTFALYGQAEGGEALWEEEQTIVLDDSGTFVAELGSASVASARALEEQFNDATTLTYYLEICVGDNDAITPRQRIYQTPTVLHASVGNGAFRDFTATGNVSVNGALWANAVDTESLALNPEDPGTVNVAKKSTIHTKMNVQYDLKTSGSISVPEICVGSVEGHLVNGMIVPWFVVEGESASIPAGWVLCDGTNGTPNLVGRFVRGAGATTPLGETYEGYQLTIENLPNHSHSGTYNRRSEIRNVLLGGAHSGVEWCDSGNSGSTEAIMYTDSNETPDGGPEPLFSTPPHREMRFIMYVGAKAKTAENENKE